MTHTPGPWAVETHAEGWGIQSPLTEERNELVATVWGHSDRPGESMRANATLIAAAPQLLAALEGAVAVMEAAARNFPTWAQQAIADGRAAIAAAKGEG